MNPGIATEWESVSANDVRGTNQLLVDLAPLPRGSGASGVSNLQAPDSRIMEEENPSPISSYLFSARVCCQRGGESDLHPLWLGHLDGNMMRQDGGTIEKWNRPERTVGIASIWQPFSLLNKFRPR